MNADLYKYLALQTALVNEKVKLEARLAAINKVLGGRVSVAAPAPATRGGKRTFSEATKAKMRAAQKARWAKLKGKAPAAATVSAPKKQRKMSAAGRAAIVAAAKARWAKVAAAKATAAKGEK